VFITNLQKCYVVGMVEKMSSIKLDWKKIKRKNFFLYVFYYLFQLIYFPLI